MGNPKLIYSPIELRMTKQYFIYPMGRLLNIEVDLVGMKIIVNFKVIVIMGEKDPYLDLLGIYFSYENYAFIDLKKETMTFKSNGMNVTEPIYLYQGPRYNDPKDDNMEVDVINQLYALIAGKIVDYINPTIDGLVSWRSVQLADEDSKETFNDWQEGQYENFSRQCATIREVIWIGMEINEYPTYDGTSYLHSFLIDMEGKVAIEHQI